MGARELGRGHHQRLDAGGVSALAHERDLLLVVLGVDRLVLHAPVVVLPERLLVLHQAGVPGLPPVIGSHHREPVTAGRTLSTVAGRQSRAGVQRQRPPLDRFQAEAVHQLGRRRRPLPSPVPAPSASPPASCFRPGAGGAQFATATAPCRLARRSPSPRHQRHVGVAGGGSRAAAAAPPAAGRREQVVAAHDVGDAIGARRRPPRPAGRRAGRRRGARRSRRRRRGRCVQPVEASTALSGSHAQRRTPPLARRPSLARRRSRHVPG